MLGYIGTSVAVSSNAPALPSIATERSQHALALASQRFSIFPLPPASKIPLVPWKDVATTDADTIIAWFDAEPDANYGVKIPEGSFVLDIDMKGGKNGLANLHELEGRHGKLPATFRVETPSGGRHYWFRGDVAQKVDIEGLGIDTRAGGVGYVVGPGCVDSDGIPYRVINSADIADAPQWLLDFIPKKSEREPSKPSAPVELDTPLAIKTAIERLEYLVSKGDVAVEGSGGQDRTYRLACELRDYGLSPEKSFELLAGHFNPHCRPPWDDSELMQICQNAENYAQNDAGCKKPKTPSETFADWDYEKIIGGADAKPSAASYLPARQTFGALDSKEEKPVEWLIPGFVEKGFAVALSGPGGSHKSRLGLQWGLSLQAGFPIFGEQGPEATFVYMSYEDREQSVLKRYNAIKRRLNLPAGSEAIYFDFTAQGVGEESSSVLSPPLITIRDGGLQLEPLWHELKAELLKIEGHKFVVMDSTYNVLNFLGTSKSDENLVKQALGWLDRLCREADATIMYLWHPSYAGQDRGDNSGWSVAWNNAPRARLGIEGKEGVFKLTVLKHNDGPQGHSIDLQWSDGILEKLGQHASDTTMRRKVLEAAIEAAEHRKPFVRKGNDRSKAIKLDSEGWRIHKLKEVYPDINTRTLRSALDQVVEDGELQYLAYTEAPGRKPGYYPLNQPAEPEAAL